MLLITQKGIFHSKASMNKQIDFSIEENCLLINYKNHGVQKHVSS